MERIQSYCCSFFFSHHMTEANKKKHRIGLWKDHRERKSIEGNGAN